jgi:hypothetical protein
VPSNITVGVIGFGDSQTDGVTDPGLGALRSGMADAPGGSICWRIERLAT